MIDPFQISPDNIDRVGERLVLSEAEVSRTPPHEFDEFNGAPFCEGKRYANGSAQGTPFQ